MTLNAPKGMAIVGDTLWVADIDAVRGFNRKSGALVANIAVPGAKFLNDVTAGPDGLYITDTGIHIGAGGMTPSRAGPRLQDRGPQGDHRADIQGTGGPQRHHLGLDRVAPRSWCRWATAPS